MTAAADQTPARPLRTAGFWAILSGGIAIIVFFAQMQIILGADTPSIGQQVGEIAGEMRRSAWRSFLGLPPPRAEPLPTSHDWLGTLQIAVPVFGVLAAALAAVSLMLRENWRLALLGAGLGCSAILFQYLWIMALLILGCLIIFAIISSIADIFGA